MKPEQFLESFVEWNLADCFDQPGDIRRAFNAAVSISHLADHYYFHSKRHQPRLVAAFRDIGDFVAHLSSQTAGGFGDVRSMSNVYKHLYTDQGRLAKYSSINSCGSIESIHLGDDEALMRLEEQYLQRGERDARMRVVVTRKDGTQVEVLPILEAVVELFRGLVYPPSA